jgi:hypothetical protein
MKVKTLIIAALLLLPASAVFAQPPVQYLDVLILKDGTSYKGVIVEQVPGETLRLETTGGTRMTFIQEEIDSIEKEKQSTRGLKVYYVDMVFLKNGIIFPGTIIEQVPGVSLTLKAANDKEITIRMEEVWKIVREKRLAGEEAPPEEEQKRMEKLKIALDLELSRRDGGEAPPASRKSEDSLEEEIERLEEELAAQGEEQEQAADPERQALEEELARLREELEAAESRGVADAEAAEQAELARITEILQMLTEELLEITKGMWTEELVAGSQAYKQDIAGLQERLAESTEKLLELVAAKPTAAGGEATELAAAAAELKEELTGLLEELRGIARQRRQEDILATKTALVPILQSPDWNTPALRPAITNLAASLPYEERQEVYREGMTRGGVGGAAINLIPAGLGSWMQRDWLGGVIAYGIAGAGLGVMLLGNFGVIPDEQTALSTGGILVMCGWGYSVIRPIQHTAAQNRKKRELLGL